MSKKPLECVVLWLQNSRGAILNITRKDDQTKYGLVGGKVDDIDFDIRSALNREVLEETGIDISAAPHKDVVTFGENGVPVHCFILDTQYADLFPSEAYANAEGTLVSWSHLYTVLGRSYSEFYEYNNKVYQHLFKDHKFADHLALGNQHVFDFVVRHLLTQNARSGDYGSCYYRDPENELKCAVGCLIHDSEYEKNFEGHGTNYVEECLLGYISGGGEPTLLDQLQCTHDNTELDVWKHSLREVADYFNLNSSVLLEYEHLS